jgi:hypothetical protein
MINAMLGAAKRRMYPGGRPNRFARVLNRFFAFAHAAGMRPNHYVTLEVPGWRSGRLISFPLVMVEYEAERYLVSMLGEDANWVRNIRAARGRAVLRHGRREDVILDEISPDARPPILRRYLSYAPGARPHIPVDRHAPVEAFIPIAAQFPVFRVTAVAARH